MIICFLVFYTLPSFSVSLFISHSLLIRRKFCSVRCVKSAEEKEETEKLLQLIATYIFFCMSPMRIVRFPKSYSPRSVNPFWFYLIILIKIISYYHYHHYKQRDSFLVVHLFLWLNHVACTTMTMCVIW